MILLLFLHTNRPGTAPVSTATVPPSSPPEPGWRPAVAQIRSRTSVDSGGLGGHPVSAAVRGRAVEMGGGLRVEWVAGGR